MSGDRFVDRWTRPLTAGGITLAPNKWARVAKAEAHGLRRGAWYPVVNDTTDSMIVLDVNKENRPVSRAWLQFRDQRPTKWSVVRRDPEDQSSNAPTILHHVVCGAGEGANRHRR